MNKDQLARHRKVQQTLDNYASAVASVPAFARLAARFGQQLALLGGAGAKNTVTPQGYTLTKNKASTALIARLVKVANALYLLYKSEGNLEDATKILRNPTDYRNLNELVLATAADLSRRATARANDLTDYNISAADVQALATDAASFYTQLTAPQLAIDADNIKGATAKATLNALNSFLKDDLRAGIELLKDTHEEAYQALREASRVAERKKAPPEIGAKLLEDATGLVWLDATGTIWLELTVNTVCEWQFTLSPSINECQSSSLPTVRVKQYAQPTVLIGQSYAWTLTVSVVDNKPHDYSGRVRLVQGASAQAGKEVYAYDIASDTIDPAGGTLSAVLTDTLTFASI